MDGEKPFVQIMRTRNWKAKKGESKFKKKVKTKSSRKIIINLPPIIIDEFKKLKVIEFDENSPAFYMKNQRSLPSHTTILKSFSDAFNALNMPWSGSHITRYTAGTLALIAVKDLAVVQAMLGHSTVAQTQKYAKVIALQDNLAPIKNAELLGL